MKTIEQPQTASLPSLGLCILMDLGGYISFSIPAIGEFSDVIWAPLSAFLFVRMFGGRLGAFGGALHFIEEILPFTDVVPSFTIAYFIRKHSLEKYLPGK
ncbi:MAG: hypothetical protein WKF88_05880 [Ferruginibacter sp.]